MLVLVTAGDGGCGPIFTAVQKEKHRKQLAFLERDLI
jgi:hypothetical protein